MELPRCLLQSLADKGWAYSDKILSPEKRQDWQNFALNQKKLGHFRPATVAAGLRPEIRSDSIHWLDSTNPENHNIHFELELWRKNLAKELRVSAPLTEAHFAHYSPGQGYQRHCDQPRGSGARVLTFVVYLHAEWQPHWGGELVIFDGNSDSVIDKIDPQPGRVVFFKSSEVWHQVRESHFDRLSLTGWFRHP